MTAPSLSSLDVPDDAMDAWFRRSEAEWVRAHSPRARKPYTPPEPPAIRVPGHVTREVFGRFLVDRATGIVHDATRAEPTCDLDGITDGTWYALWRHVPADPKASTPCPTCLVQSS